jgi:hypothetical protein
MYNATNVLQGLWAPLLEKAYAKLHGGYHSLTAAAARRPQSADAHNATANMDELLHPDEAPSAAGGQQNGYTAAAEAGLQPPVPVVPGSWSLREALMDLTGGTVTKMRLDSEQLGAEVASGAAATAAPHPVSACVVQQPMQLWLYCVWCKSNVL